jgi:hypothetical protein
MHHVVGDEWSAGILRREVAILYRAFRDGTAAPLQDLPVQYADFAVWQRRWLTGDVLERQLTFWRERLTGAPVLELPTDRPRPAVRSSEGSVVEFADPTGKVMTIEISNVTKQGAVSPSAPLGAALMGAREGDEVEVTAPRSTWTARIVSIRTA